MEKKFIRVDEVAKELEILVALRSFPLHQVLFTRVPWALLLCSLPRSLSQGLQKLLLQMLITCP